MVLYHFEINPEQIRDFRNMLEVQSNILKYMITIKKNFVTAPAVKSEQEGEASAKEAPKSSKPRMREPAAR